MAVEWNINIGTRAQECLQTVLEASTSVVCDTRKKVFQILQFNLLKKTNMSCDLKVLLCVLVVFCRCVYLLIHKQGCYGIGKTEFVHFCKQKTRIAFQYDAYRSLVERISQYALRRGVYLAGGGGLPCQGRGSALPGEMVSQHALRQTLPLWTESQIPVNRITDACENITLPQLRCGR